MGGKGSGKKRRHSLIPLMDQRVRSILRRKDLSLKDELAVLKLAADIEKKVGGDEGDWGGDLPSPPE